MRANEVYLHPRCIIPATTVHAFKQATRYIRLVTVSSSAVGIVSEQPRTHIDVPNCQLKKPRENIPVTKKVFEK